MSYMVPKLKHRIDIQEALQSPNTAGGFNLDYETLRTVWAGLRQTNINDFVSAVRGEQVTDFETHEFKVRRDAVRTIGKSNTSAFSSEFNNSPDINPLKSEYFIFKREGSAVRGRRFRILGTRLDEDNNEFILIRCKELEEKGTGHQETIISDEGAIPVVDDTVAQEWFS